MLQPYFLYLCNQFILPKQLLKEINRCIDSSGNVLDNASKELRRISNNFSTSSYCDLFNMIGVSILSISR